MYMYSVKGRKNICRTHAIVKNELQTIYCLAHTKCIFTREGSHSGEGPDLSDLLLSCTETRRRTVVYSFEPIAPPQSSEHPVRTSLVQYSLSLPQSWSITAGVGHVH